MQLNNLDKIAELEKKNFKQPLSRDELNTIFLDPNYKFYFDDNGYLITLNTDITEIVSIAVDKKRQGTATKLLSNLKGRILLEVRKSNEAAISFYKKHGFKKISERKRYYKDGEDAIIMEVNK